MTESFVIYLLKKPSFIGNKSTIPRQQLASGKRLKALYIRILDQDEL